MIDPQTLELAKLGDATAIASAITYLLQDKNISAKALIKQDCLMVMLESAPVPDRNSSVSSINQLMNRLTVTSINSVKIFGKELDKNYPAWTEVVPLNYQIEPEKQPEIKEIKKSDWPAWFPYPSSWLRTLALVVWIAIVLRITGFWGIVFGTILSQLAQNPDPLLKLLGISLLVSVIFFSYVHHCLFGKSPAKWPRWLPSPRSLWEGLYAPTVMILSGLGVVAIMAPFLPIFECNDKTILYVEYCFANYIYKYNLVKVALVVWGVVALYFYQIETLIREKFTKKSKNIAETSKPEKPVDEIALELDNLREKLGTTQKQSLNPQQMASKAVSDRLPNKLVKTSLVFLSMFILGMAATIGFVKWPQIKESIAFNIGSKTPSAVLNTPITPTPETSPSPIAPDTFRDAVNKAIDAAKLTQTAKSQNDWNQVIDRWQDAIALMKNVPASHPNYETAQKKAIEYQRNLEYATLAASRVK